MLLNRNPKILVLAGSIRSGAYSQQTADAFVAELVNHKCEITRITLADYELPIVLETPDSQSDIPKNAQKLARQFHNHDAMVIATPEYNGSLPPLLKNAIDWISLTNSVDGRPVSPFRGKLCAVASSSSGKFAGTSALTHLRQVLTRLGMLVIAEQIAVGNAASAFDDKGRLVDDRSASMMAAAAKSLVEKATLLA